MKEHIAPNLRTVINKPAVFVQDNAPCHRAKSVKIFISEEDANVMEWPTQSSDMNPIENVWKLLNERKRIQETLKIYGLIWKEKGGKYPLMNARHQFVRVAKDERLLLKVKVYTSSFNGLWTLFLFRYDVSIIIVWFC